MASCFSTSARRGFATPLPLIETEQAIKKILHISNTDINLDSRIRKELAALGTMKNTEVAVIGVSQNRAEHVCEIDGASCLHLRLRSRALSFMPRAVQYFFELFEFTAKVALQGRSRRPDVIHCHDTFALPAGWVIKLLLSCKLVYDAHELESNKNGQNFLLSRATLLIERLCWSRIDVLVSVSNSIIDWYQRHLGPKQSILVLNSPVLGTMQAPNTLGVVARARYFHLLYRLHDDELVFVYLGILGPGRGIEICLDAFANGSSKAHVVFIGHGTLESRVIEFSARHANIHLHAAVPHDEVVSLVASADYGLCLVENVSLSDYYCLPNKLFEYCFARLPVLASNFPEIGGLVAKFRLGVCCDPDPASVRQALHEIVANRPSFPVEDISSLSWDAQAQRLVDVYQQQLLVESATEAGSTVG